MSLGGAFTGLADDPSAAFYNPAGLAGQRGALSVEHVPINESGLGLNFSNGRLDHLAIQYPGPYGTFGFNIQQFAIGGIEARAKLTDSPTEIKVSQTLYSVPCGVAFGRLALGVAGKAVSYSLGQYRDTGFGADLGAKVSLWENDTKLGRETRVSLGLAVRNAMAPTLKLIHDPVALERVVVAGVSITALVHETYVKGADVVAHDFLALSFDLARGNLSTSIKPAAGLEYSFRGQYALRGGMNASGNMTMGAGYGGPATAFRVDYAAELTGLSPQHHFSVAWQFTALKTPVESDVHMTSYRLSVFDQERLKSQFLKQGKEAALNGNYSDALTSFNKASVLDPEDTSVGKLAVSSAEGNRLAGVKLRLDSARRLRAVGRTAEAEKSVLDAVSFDPESKEAADYLVELHNAMASSGTVGEFELARGRAIEQLSVEFSASLADFNITSMRRQLKAVRAMAPDNRAAWEGLQEKLTAAELEWQQVYSVQGQDAVRRADAMELARALRRLRRVNPNHKVIALLAPQLRRLAKTSGGTFYDGNYLSQLYNTAAVDYALGNVPQAVDHLRQLLKERATHEEGNKLVDRMRDEGLIKETEEP